MKSNTSQFHTEKGFVLLFAVLIASVVLAIGTGIFNISRKELILSRASRDSQFAFFAADAGAECAFFWDRKYSLIPPFEAISAFPSTNADPMSPTQVRCNNTDIVVAGQGPGIPWIVTSDATSATTQFTLIYPNNSCAKVTVAKTNSGLNTTVTSVGQSVCSETDQNVVQRTIEASY